MARSRILLAAAFLLGAPAASADEPTAPPPLDEVVLVTGGVLEGTIVEETGTGVVLAFPESGGGSARMTIPRNRIREIRRAAERPPVPRGPEAPLRDVWFLLKSEGRVVGTRHLLLRRARSGEAPGWRLEEQLVWFARGLRSPEVRTFRSETTDLALYPLALEHREEGDPLPEPGAEPFHRMVAGRVEEGVWRARVSGPDGPVDSPLTLPPGTRGRLGAREDFLRRRALGLASATILDAAGPRLASVRAGYTQIDLPDPAGGPPRDEFAWEEDGRTLLARVTPEGIVHEEVAEGVIAVPVTAAQAAAAAAEARGTESPDPSTAPTRSRVTLPEVGIAFVVPGPGWTVDRPVVSSADTGRLVVARLGTPLTVSDIRVEWEPDGALGAPGAEEAEAALLQRLRGVCPDLEVTATRRPLERPAGGWRLEFVGTLKGEAVRTIAVVLDRGAARILCLLAAPSRSFSEARPDLEAFVRSLEVL